MLERVLIAGSGGQGVILTGKLLASVAVSSIEHITFYPAYGAEVRGGTSHCQVILSSSEIASPVTELVDTYVIMNQQSADRFLPAAGADALVALNTSLARAPSALAGELLCVPATAMADDMGDARVSNLIMLGAYLAARPVVPLADVEKGILELLGHKGSKTVEINLEALRRGLAVHT